MYEREKCRGGPDEHGTNMYFTRINSRLHERMTGSQSVVS